VVVSSVSRDTGWSTAVAMGAFSTGAVTAALAGIVVGRLIDARGPRAVMTTGSVLGVLGALAVAGAPNLPLFYAAWVLAGLAQAALLYPPAFAALTGWYGARRVRALTTLTLVGGFASTVFAPLVATLLDHMSWRGVYVVLACVLGVVTLPLHAVFLKVPWPGRDRTDAGDAEAAGAERAAHARAVLRSRAFVVLSAAMAVGAFGMYAATVNLVPLLTARGLGTHLAAVGLGLCGAGQVLGRTFYVPIARRTSPRARTVIVLVVAAVTVVVLGVLPGPVAVLLGVAVLAGAARGVYTLLQATAVSDRWGTAAFGRVNGVFAAPITAVTALAPGGGALVADLAGGYPAAYTALAVLTIAGAVAAATTSVRQPQHVSR
jgi:MFS family permease